eukprot:5094389-Alexandrium_andersonii.AAC.1
MIQQGLLGTDERTAQREVEDFKAKIAGTPLYRYLMELPVFPSVMDSVDGGRDTILGRRRQ